MPNNNKKEKLNIHLDGEIIKILNDIARKENKDIAYIIELFIKVGVEQYLKKGNALSKNKADIKIVTNLEEKVNQSIKKHNKEINELNENADKIFILEDIEEQIDDFEKKLGVKKS